MRDHFLERDDVRGEFADALGELVGGHGVLVEEPAEDFFVHVDFQHIGLRGRGGVELAGDGGVGFLEFLEEFGGDGEEVAAGEFGDLAGVAETRAHDLRLVAEFFVVGVDAADGLDARVLGALVVGAGFGFVVVVDAADEG